MPPQLISRSPDLQRLADEGYEIEVRGGHLLLKQVPYVTEERVVERATLVSPLDLAGDVAARPSSHVVMFTGRAPCNSDGKPLSNIIHSAGQWDLGGGLVARHKFSSKPAAGYADYYAKMSTYAEILSGYAQAIDPAATARTFLVVPEEDTNSVFQYVDTASSRAEIAAITEKLTLAAVAIVGLGGTGSYILDLVAKTPVGEIHLFDGDVFGQHNAFRAPGAPSVNVLRARPRKSDYLRSIYSNMHRNIISHGYLDQGTTDILSSMDFAFVAVDDADARRLAVETLLGAGVRFVDVGMGVSEVDGALLGQLRVTSATPDDRDHVLSTIPLTPPPGDDDYSQNIQIADLNALNAALAVLKWKKLMGFYLDLGQEHSSWYQIDGNHLVNEARA